LDLLDTLPKELCYNIARVAEAPFTGLTHTLETLAKISVSMTGRTHTPETRAQMSGAYNPMFGLTGALSPRFGITPTNAMNINVYSPDDTLINSFSSQVAAANWVNISRTTLQRYLSSGKVWNNLYIFRAS
jgi:group I intron endonuclease